MRGHPRSKVVTLQLKKKCQLLSGLTDDSSFVTHQLRTVRVGGALKVGHTPNEMAEVEAVSVAGVEQPGVISPDKVDDAAEFMALSGGWNGPSLAEVVALWTQILRNVAPDSITGITARTPPTKLRYWIITNLGEHLAGGLERMGVSPNPPGPEHDDAENESGDDDAENESGEDDTENESGDDDAEANNAEDGDAIKGDPRSEVDVENDAPKSEVDVENDAPKSEVEAENDAMEEDPKNEPGVEDDAPKSEPEIEDDAPKSEPDVDDDAPKSEPEVDDDAPKSEPEVEDDVPKSEPDVEDDAAKSEGEGDVMEEDPKGEGEDEDAEAAPPPSLYIATPHTLQPKQPDWWEDAVRNHINALGLYGVPNVDEVIATVDPGVIYNILIDTRPGWTQIRARYGNDGGGERICGLMVMAQICGLTPKSADDVCIKIIGHTLALMALILKLDDGGDEMTMVALQSNDGDTDSSMYGRLRVANILSDGNDLDINHFFWFQRCFSGVREALSQAGLIASGRGVAPEGVKIDIIKHWMEKKKQVYTIYSLSLSTGLMGTSITVRHLPQNNGHWELCGFYSVADAIGMKSSELADEQLAKLFPKSPLYRMVMAGDKEGRLTPSGTRGRTTSQAGAAESTRGSKRRRGGRR